MKKKILSIAAGVLAGLLFGVGLDGWNAKSTGATVDVAEAKLAEPDARRVKLSPELARRAKLKVEQMGVQPRLPSLRLVGSVNFDARPRRGRSAVAQPAARAAMAEAHFAISPKSAASALAANAAAVCAAPVW